MRYLGRSFFLMRALLFVIGLGAISVQTVSAATCAGSGAKPGMDLGALQSVKAGKIKMRSLEALAVLTLTASYRKRVGWIAFDERGDKWIQLSNDSPNWVRAYFGMHPPARGAQLFMPYFRALPPTLSVQACDFDVAAKSRSDRVVGAARQF